MGFAICTGSCAGCGRVFSFNPVRVPSVRINDVREPVCETCIRAANTERLRMGLEPFHVPDNAYEAVDEAELYG